MKERLLALWQARKVRIVTVVLAIAYAALVKAGWEPVSDLWDLAKELVFAIVG